MMAEKRELFFYGVAGDRYEGEWEDGKEHGAGTAVASDGSSFFGTWVHGKRHGEGVSPCINRLHSFMVRPFLFALATKPYSWQRQATVFHDMGFWQSCWSGLCSL